MMAQKKGNKNPDMVHYLPKNVVDFELLWKCISKMQDESTKMRCMRGKIPKLE